MSKKSTRALTGERILNKPISNYLGTAGVGGAFPGFLDWKPIGSTGLYAESYFDLSGYELDDLTLVPRYIRLQDGNPYFADASSMRVFDVISQERLNPVDFIFYTVGGDYPSSKGSTQDWSQILFCNTRFFTPQTDFSFPTLQLPATSGTFGSLEATAVQKLWIYRVVIFTDPVEGGVLNIPATRFVLAGDIVDEPELEYIMRLKRSYELSTQG